MANTQSSPLAQPQKEVKVHPKDALGGAFEYFENLFETMAGTGTGFVNERPVSSADFEKVKQLPEHKTGNFPSRGSFENFQEVDQRQVATKIIENAIVQSHQQKRELTIEEMARYGLADTPKQQLAVEGNYQANYEGESVDSTYNLVFVFFKRIGQIIKEKIKSSFNPFEAVKGKLSRKDYFMQHNMAGERQGGQHVFNAAG